MGKMKFAPGPLASMPDPSFRDWLMMNAKFRAFNITIPQAKTLILPSSDRRIGFYVTNQDAVTTFISMGSPEEAFDGVAIWPLVVGAAFSQALPYVFDVWTWGIAVSDTIFAFVNQATTTLRVTEIYTPHNYSEILSALSERFASNFNQRRIPTPRKGNVSWPKVRKS